MTDIKIADAFKNGKAFIPFITGGDPDLDTTKELILALQDAGSDLIEIGIPFSDPIAEGPVIQEADERALAAGTTTDKLFDMLKELHDEGKVTVPMVFLTYANAIFAYGKEKFMKRCVESGMQGIIVPDIPFEEKEEFEDVANENGISIISMIAPTSEDRIKMIAKEAKGFLYVVSSMGVTGVREEFATNIEDMIATVREVSDIPAAVGFGISNPDQAQGMAEKSDGAIVGSAIVKIVGQYGKDCVPHVAEFARQLKDGVQKATA
ncbi:tryptophan synthase, alpha chain [Butyrivibrio fibrisolvens DSM 3071]|uniref:Tryptophan synthase alpha chain n=1 Tax=Butyrivibrio fibrisolvens DSM 3071 TaxID=1121131 RepID=A0A1M6C3Z2_BUTFI|nr:tryptophan synthase subunit alpha [Butyrivibrio fibrisolvens]SHI55746.1 tryptophan synthase, alpha chain [Butyrivibrio fibrisolvens DSM 3071]